MNNELSIHGSLCKINTINRIYLVGRDAVNISVVTTLDLINGLGTICCVKPETDDCYIHTNSFSGGNTIIKILS